MKALRNALSCRWGRKDGVIDLLQRRLAPFSLPSPPSDWPTGTGFATGQIPVGELDLAEVTAFEEVWSTSKGGSNKQGATFFKPINIPSGYHCLGYYCQLNTGTLDGWVLVAREGGNRPNGKASSEAPTAESSQVVDDETKKVPLASPVDYTLVWSSIEWKGKCNGMAFFWLPCAPDGYIPAGYVVTNTAEKPSITEVMCVRTDLTDSCKTADALWCTKSTKVPFSVWNVYPSRTGIDEKGILVGTFCCSSTLDAAFDIPIASLKNTASTFSSMPNADQIHALMSSFGPVIYFHPNETFFPSSVTWFFDQGALLYKKGMEIPEKVAFDGSNLPVGGLNDGEHWIGLPDGDVAEMVKKGDLASAKGYVQVKPMLGGTFTDLVIWIYYPFNGPSTAKVGMVDVPLGKIGEHVSDWEHVTLRISNFNGHLRKVYFAQHSGGLWVNASELEYAHGNNAAVYASRHGHASYPHPGLVLQGGKQLGVGIRNDTGQSVYSLDTGKKYEIVSAEYLRVIGADGAPNEPTWLHYACEWGPKVQYDSRAELDKVLQRLPRSLRSSLQSLVSKFPHELSGEQGPTGPRQKNYWLGDERVKHH